MDCFVFDEAGLVENYQKRISMKKLLFALSLFLGLTSSLFASATIFAEDGGDTVRFAVNVDADAYMDGQLIGKVQAGNFVHQFQRDKEGSKTITFKKDGYEETSVTVQRKMDYLVLANLFGSWFSTSSTTTDVMKGNHKAHTPGQFMINMRKIEK